MWVGIKRGAAAYGVPATAALLAGAGVVAEADGTTENPALISAVSVFRHGQRVPIHKHHAVDSSTGWEDAILRPHDEPPVEMLHTSTAAKLPLPGSPSEPKRALPTFGSKDAPAGTLTRNGLRQLISVGADLRKRYLTADDVKSCLIPAGMTPEDAARRGLLYLRTTHTPRTLQSLQGVVSGLAGSDESAPKDASPVPVYSLSTQHESLYPNASHCPELISMAVEGVTRFFEHANDESHPNNYLALQARLDAALGSATLEPDVETIQGARDEKKKHHHHHRQQKKGDDDKTVYGKPPQRWDFVRIRDLLVSLQADGQSLPAGITDADMKELEKASTQQLCHFVEGAAKMAASAKAAEPEGSSSTPAMRLASGRLLQELQLRIEQAALAHSLYWHDVSLAAKQQQADAPKITVALPSWATSDHYLQLQLALLAQPYFPQETAGLEAAPMPADSTTATTSPSSSSTNASVPRLSLLSGHDTSLLPILGALGLHNGEHWPPFASHIEIELFSSLPSPPTLGGSKGSGKDGEMTMMTTADAIRYLAAHTSSTPFAVSPPQQQEGGKDESLVSRLTHKASDALHHLEDKASEKLHHAADSLKKAAEDSSILGAVVDSEGIPAFPERIAAASDDSVKDSVVAKDNDDAKEMKALKDALAMARGLVDAEKNEKSKKETTPGTPAASSLSASQTAAMESLMDKFLDAVTSKDDKARSEALKEMNKLLDEAAGAAANVAMDAVAQVLGAVASPEADNANADTTATTSKEDVEKQMIREASDAVVSLLGGVVERLLADAQQNKAAVGAAEEATKKAVDQAVSETQTKAALTLAKALAYGEKALKAITEQGADALREAVQAATKKAESVIASERAKAEQALAQAEREMSQKEDVARSLAQTLSEERLIITVTNLAF